jgi:parvulin-like peptidyl-prolyl isomerase
MIKPPKRFGFGGFLFTILGGKKMKKILMMIVLVSLSGIADSLERKLKEERIYSLAQEAKVENLPAYKEELEKASRYIQMKLFLQNKRDSIVVKEKEVKEYYNTNIRDYTKVAAYTLIRNSHKDLLPHIKTLQKTPKDKLEEVFQNLALKYSQHPSKHKKGYLNYIGYDYMVQPFGKEAFLLKKNSFSKHKIKTTLGYHIIYVKDIKTIPYDVVKNKIEYKLRMERYKKWFSLQ